MHRGEIYYIRSNGYPTTGSEHKPDRPAVIVSNDMCNATSDVVEVVYLTTQAKKDLPTHVYTHSTGRLSTVLCEMVNSVAKERIGNYCGTLTADELKAVDLALAISLGLDFGNAEPKVIEKTVEKIVTQKPTDAELADMAHEYALEMGYVLRTQAEPAPTNTVTVDLVKAETERDLYRKLYDNMVDMLVGLAHSRFTPQDWQSK